MVSKEKAVCQSAKTWQAFGRVSQGFKEFAAG